MKVRNHASEWNAGPLEGRLIEFRVGVHFGEMVDEKSGNPSGAARVPEE